MVIGTMGGGGKLAYVELPHCMVISPNISTAYSTTRISQCTFLSQMLAM